MSWAWPVWHQHARLELSCVLSVPHSLCALLTLCNTKAAQTLPSIQKGSDAWAAAVTCHRKARGSDKIQCSYLSAGASHLLPVGVSWFTCTTEQVNTFLHSFMQHGESEHEAQSPQRWHTLHMSNKHCTSRSCTCCQQAECKELMPRCSMS